MGCGWKNEWIEWNEEESTHMFSGAFQFKGGKVFTFSHYNLFFKEPVRLAVLDIFDPISNLDFKDLFYLCNFRESDVKHSFTSPLKNNLFSRFSSFLVSTQGGLTIAVLPPHRMHPLFL